MKPNEERQLTFEEQVEALLKTAVPLPKLKPKAIPKPKAAVVKAGERWSGEKPLAAVLQDAQRADEAAAERLRRERQERNERIAAEHRLAHYQATIDAAWLANRDYQRELAQWGSQTCHRGPGDPDWRW
jgi:hypothetical protein